MQFETELKGRAEMDIGGRGSAFRVRVAMAIFVVGVLGSVQSGCQGEPPEAGELVAEPQAGAIHAYVMDGGEAAGDAGVDSVRGSFLGNFIVSVYDPEGIWVDLGRRAQMTVPLSNATPSALLEELHVPPGTYTKVRVLLCHSSAEVGPGSRVAGATVDEPSHVHLTETGDIYIIRDVQPFHVSPTHPVNLDIDLNSAGWLTWDALTSGMASIPTFEDQVQVRVRGG